MNVLMTCAGRRIHTVQIFKEAVSPHGQVIACDYSSDAPALHFADRGCVVPSIAAEAYCSELLALCRTHRVGLLIPALEPELPLLAAHREEFLKIGTLPLVSGPGVTETCYDKMKTIAFLEECGIASPETFTTLEETRAALRKGVIRFPLILKPRWGAGSMGVEICYDDEELECAWLIAPKRIRRELHSNTSGFDWTRCVLVQPYLCGVEYGVDIVNNLRGEFACSLVRRKLRMRCGQTDRALTVRHDRIERAAQTIGEQLEHTGLLDADFFEADGKLYVLDLNPRLGGGYPFSHLAGANLPAALVAWARGTQPEPEWLQQRSGVVISKSDGFVLINSTEGKVS